jgi:hypothetical protein
LEEGSEKRLERRTGIAIGENEEKKGLERRKVKGFERMMGIRN